MAATHTTAHVSINRKFSHPLTQTMSKNAPRCALSPQNSRRMLSISLFILHSFPAHAIAASVFDRYVKRALKPEGVEKLQLFQEFLVKAVHLCMPIRKKLEPLETYVPAIILTQLQIKDIEESLEVDQPQYAAYRSFLRSGPAASFRSNIRSVAEYASDGGRGKTAFDDVDQCLRALDELDSLLLRASRNNPEASPKVMKEKITTAVNALNSLLQTVPSDILDKAKAIADAYRTIVTGNAKLPIELRFGNFVSEPLGNSI